MARLTMSSNPDSIALNAGRPLFQGTSTHSLPDCSDQRGKIFICSSVVYQSRSGMVLAQHVSYGLQFLCYQASHPSYTNLGISAVFSPHLLIHPPLVVEVKVEMLVC